MVHGLCFIPHLAAKIGLPLVNTPKVWNYIYLDLNPSMFWQPEKKQALPIRTYVLVGLFVAMLGALGWVYRNSTRQTLMDLGVFSPIYRTFSNDDASPSADLTGEKTAEELESERLLRERPLGLPCLQSTKKFCVLRPDDPLFAALGIDPRVALFEVGGKKESVANIYFQIAFEDYSEEPITDSAGKTITASKKDYDAPSKSLTIYVGAKEDYYRLIPADQQKQLYLAQIVRSLLVMTGDTSSDFKRTFEITNQLVDWSPQF